MSSVPSARAAPDPSESGATSLSLLCRLKSREPAAWDRLVHLYAPLVFHWCRRLNLPMQDAADVFQDVFQAVAAKIDGFRKERPADTFRGWLRTITHNKVYDHYRRTGREPSAAGGTEANLRLSEIPASELPDDASDDLRANDQLVHRALELIRPEFAPRTWQAFWRVVVDGQCPADVAEELSMKPGTVRVAKSRVLHRLRQELGEIFG